MLSHDEPLITYPKDEGANHGGMSRATFTETSGSSALMADVPGRGPGDIETP